MSGPYDLAALHTRLPELSAEFAGAVPFPHVVVDGLLKLSPSEAGSFPDADWSGWTRLGDEYQRNKRACDDIERIPSPMAEVIAQWSTPRALRILEALSGIKGLVPDPYLTGGGIHLSGPGGILAPHTDFHHYRALNLFRRLNVLVYLNDGWAESDGGCLSLYHGDQPVKTVVPQWGRTVIFRTDDNSVHGFPQPVVDGRWRRSIALYYYTATPARDFSGDETTYWRQHGALPGVSGRARMAAYRGLLNTSRAISIAAHVVNPNQGIGLVKARLRDRRGS